MRVTITNNEPAGGRQLLAQVFYVAPDGTPDAAPFDARVVFPGITAILSVGASNALVLQQAPDEAGAAAASGGV